MEELERLKLKRLVAELEAIKGKYTELISLYVPAGAELSKVVDMLSQEVAFAQRVKDKAVRKNVSAALEKIITHLRLLKCLPPNGVVIFCGNVSPEPGRSEIKLWCIEPPVPLSVKLYRCNHIFVLNPLKEVLAAEEVYGLIVLDAQQATLGMLRGKSVLLIKSLESNVPQKVMKGGMSAVRYRRIREEALNEFFKQVGEHATKAFLPLPVKGLLIGGPGPIKEEFFKGNFLHHQLQSLVLGVKSTGYTDEYGLYELVERSMDLLQQASIAKELDLLFKFFTELRKDGLVVYGVGPVVHALHRGALGVLMLSEDLRLFKVEYACECGYRDEVVTSKVERRCKCGRELRVEGCVDWLEELIKDAERMGCEVKLISSSTKEGAQFKELGGIGGLLRYKL